MILFLKVIPMRFFSVVLFLHAFKIESSLQKFCPGLFKSRWHGYFSIMHRERSSLQRPVACNETASGQLQNCSRLSSTPRSPLCVIPPHFCQSVAWNTNPTPGPYSSLSVLSGTETSELPSQILLSQHLLLQ